MLIAHVDHGLEAFGDIVGQEIPHLRKVPGFESHEDHLVSSARAFKECTHLEPRLCHLHGGKRLGAAGTILDMIGDIVVRATFDHIEFRAARRARLGRSRDRRFLEPFPGSQNAPQTEDQEDGNSGKNQQLDQG